MNEAGLEPTTSSSGGWRSIQLSYSSDVPESSREAPVCTGGWSKPGRRVHSGAMNSTDPRLTELLASLLSEERLPPVDRWFSRIAKERRWPAQEQKRLWDGLRTALCRGLALAGASGPTEWSGFRVVLRGRAREWAELADRAGPAGTLAEAGIPGWWKPQWDERKTRSAWTDAQAESFLEKQRLPAPVYVRFRWGAEGDAARLKWERSGMVAGAIEGIPRLETTAGVESTEEWRRGLVEIQDAASQLSLRHLALRPGQRVWDVCAGRGGKTLQAAGELRGKGALFATDISEGKLAALKDRLKRSAWQNVRLGSWNGETLPDFGPERKQGFDRVIVDVPCTASGTWRRDPEGRYRVTPATLKELERHQTRLLRLGWSALSPGGRLAYVTCSWLPAENEAVVEAFVRESGAAVVVQELLGLPSFDASTVYSAILEKPRSAP